MAKPINQLRSVNFSLCVEANTWTHETRDDQCSASLTVFVFLFPQDESVSALTPSLLFSCFNLFISLSLSVCLTFWSHSPSSPPPLLFCCLSLFLSRLASSFQSLLLLLSLLRLSPRGLVCLLFVFLPCSPPAEGEDVSRCGGYRGAAVGITAATLLLKN